MNMYRYQTIKLSEITEESSERLIANFILNNEIDVIPPHHYSSRLERTCNFLCTFYPIIYMTQVLEKKMRMWKGGKVQKLHVDFGWKRIQTMIKKKLKINLR